MSEEKSIREWDWWRFSTIVAKHIANYTIPQYGDAPDDQIEGWTHEECVRAIGKRAARHSSNARGRIETLRDLVKIAHEAQLAFDKMRPYLDELLSIERGTR